MPQSLEFLPLGLWQFALTLVTAAVLISAVMALVWIPLKLTKSRHTFPLTWLAPGFLGLILLSVLPFVFEAVLAFSNMEAKVTAAKDYFNHPDFGWQYFAQHAAEAFRDGGFLYLAGINLVGALNLLFWHFFLGLGLALLVNRAGRLRGVYQTLLALPWAIPSTLALMVWRGEYDYNLGSFNQLAIALGLGPRHWEHEPFFGAFLANVILVWSAMPLIFLALSAALRSIPAELYEVAELDGIGPLRRLIRITLPLIKPLLAPLIFLDFIWIFNNATPSLHLPHGPWTLVSVVYSYFIETPSRYGMAAAFAFFSFLFLMVLVLVLVQATGTAEKTATAGRSPESLPHDKQ